MGKKKSSGTHYTSKGQVGVNKYVSRMVRASRHPADRQMAQMAAFRQGRNVVFTVPNPDPNATNKRMIRVNGKDYLGDFRDFRGWEKPNRGKKTNNKDSD